MGDRALRVQSPDTAMDVAPRNAEAKRYADAYLAFDPAVPPRYEVVLLPIVPPAGEEAEDG